MDRLRYTAGNLYVNDNPTGAVLGQQPFGGSRASGTRYQAGSEINLLRWVPARSLKEAFLPATDYRYPFMKEKQADPALNLTPWERRNRRRAA